MRPLTLFQVMALTLALVLLPAQAGCRYDFTPGGGGGSDPEGRDGDGRVADGLKPDSGKSNVTADMRSPDGCPTKLPAGWTGSGDCTKTAAWACLDTCGSFARIACFEGSKLLREIRCNDEGSCECRVGVTAKPVFCSELLKNGRTGCDLCKDALLQGCCRPVQQ